MQSSTCCNARLRATSWACCLHACVEHGGTEHHACVWAFPSCCAAGPLFLNDVFVGSLSIECAALRGSLWLPCIDRIALRDYFCLLCMLAGSCMRACAHTYIRTVPTYHIRTVPTQPSTYVCPASPLLIGCIEYFALCVWAQILSSRSGRKAVHANRYRACLIVRAACASGEREREREFTLTHCWPP